MLCLMGGDFNEILTYEEKKGGSFDLQDKLKSSRKQLIFVDFKI